MQTDPSGLSPSIPGSHRHHVGGPGLADIAPTDGTTRDDSAIRGGAAGSIAQVLELDADVMAEHLQAVIAWMPVHGAPARIVDLGAGTGAGTFALLRAFPAATVTAVDSSAEHLELLRDRARREGLEHRVRTLEVDLDAPDWPDLGRPDLVWASASMHHLADPVRAIRTVREALEPKGLFVVLELSGMPRFLPPDAPESRPGLEERSHAALAPATTAHMPHRGADWAPKLTAAGLDVAAHLPLDVTIESARSDAIGLYALAVFTGLRRASAGLLPAEDVEALDELLDTAGPHSILDRSDLTLRTTRRVWAARKPARVDGPGGYAPFSAAAEAANCERVLGNRRHGLGADVRG
ncbi:class I SAM-dependent methyltransferase [Brachybacterium tyrofermentans]|uniref:class I SAM-dependent methyltransferase n=1 Tax=Brachybacterium tyrofermentans TaxID=47848 RepID=UPI003F93A8C4